MTWTVGTRRFRSWIPEEEAAYHFLVMWAPLSPKEQAVFELFEGLDETAGKLPQDYAAIADLYQLTEARVRAIVAAARRKVAEYYTVNGLPFRAAPRKPPAAAEAFAKLRARVQSSGDRCSEL